MRNDVIFSNAKLDVIQVKTTENHTRGHHEVKNNNITLGVQVSAEELKIRSELEIEIERLLEEEIKESIYHLALKLHQIYQQRKERKTKEATESKALSEVNISIRMEGGTKIEIKEVNKEVTERGYSRSNSRPENVKAFSGNKYFDWVKTLRGGSSPVSVNRSNGSLKRKHRNRKLSTVPNVFPNCIKLDGTRGKNAGLSLQRKQNASVDNKQLQSEWKV
ncbi:hypothetical protein RIF29_36347 [Crotalaria pallida]|uniref:Uncharacterized protein n=1 Tax=Crotalaria pallida TaxID=3830 RepID=A0AAN9EHG7_CROPI